MEECYGYERNKMAMVIGVMDEDLQSCVPEFHCPSVLSHAPIPSKLSSSVSFWGGLTDIPKASRRDQPHKGRALTTRGQTRHKEP